MSTFARVATQVISKNLPQAASAPKKNEAKEAADLAKDLTNAGFSRSEVLAGLRQLADNCGEDEKSIEFQIYKTAAQMHGMLQPEEGKRETPVINLTVVGDNARISAMLSSNSGGENAR